MKDEKIKSIKKSQLIKFYRRLFRGGATLGQKMDGEYEQPVSSHVALIEKLREKKDRIEIPEQNRLILRFIKELKDYGWFVLGE